MTPIPLSRMFYAKVDKPMPAPGSLDDLEQLLIEIVRSARMAWPTVTVAEDEFLAYLAERLPPDQDPHDAVFRIESDDLYLACACARSDRAAVRAFEEAFVDELRAAVGQMRGQGADIDEVIQELRAKLLTAPKGSAPKVVEYAGRGSLRAWLRVVAVRIALARHRGKKKEVSLNDELLDGLPGAAMDDPELLHFKRTYQVEFKDCFETAFGALSRKDRNLLRQHLLDGLGIDGLAAIYRVHRATAARWLASAREQLFDETRRLLRQRLDIDEDEFRSIVKLVRSQLDLSLHRLFNADGSVVSKKRSE